MHIFQKVPTIIFRIFRSALVFLIKPKQLQKNRKQKEIKERERNLPNLPVKPTWRPKWPAQPTRPPFCRLPPPRPEAARWRAPESPRPPPASTWEPRAFYQRHGDARRPCPLSLTRCSLSPPLALSPELTRGPPSPPLAAAAPRATAPPLHRV